MNTITLIGIAVVVFLILAMLAIKNVNMATVIKAGDIKDFQLRYLPDFTSKPAFIQCDENVISTDGMGYMLVRGDSMKWYDIHSGNHVLIRYFSEEEKQKIGDKPVLLFSMDEAENAGIWGREYWESHYKLRKFITYLPSREVDFGSLYDQHKDEITISREKFVSKCNERVQELGDDARYILSETYDKDEKENRYSLHGIAHLLGQVEYVVA